MEVLEPCFFVVYDLDRFSKAIHITKTVGINQFHISYLKAQKLFVAIRDCIDLLVCDFLILF